jgi:glutamine synthetase
MSDVAPRFFEGESAGVMDWLRASGVQFVRVQLCDLSGISRGKAVTLEHFERVLAHGLPFAAAILAIDVEATVVPGTPYAESTGYADLIAKPDLSSLRLLRHEPHSALVLCDAFWPDGQPVEADPRRVLHRQVEELEALGLTARAAPEFEFYILDDRYELIGDGVQAYSMQRRHMFLAEEQALIAAVAAHCQIECSSHEYGPGQYEVTMRYGTACSIADFGQLFRWTMKEAALSLNRRVTFMAKPFDGYSGNSCHIHLSLWDGGDTNVFAAPDRPLGISETCRYFIGGVLAHLNELAAIYLPNANSYRRIVPGAFAPFSRAWGIDNRTAAVRVLNERRESTRTELRICGGDVNFYLVLAALLAAGTDGIRHQIDPDAPATGDLDSQDVERLPLDWGKALDAFEASSWAKTALGEEFCQTYALIKRHEFEVSRRSVSAQERARYAEFL